MQKRRALTGFEVRETKIDQTSLCFQLLFASLPQQNDYQLFRVTGKRVASVLGILLPRAC